MCGLCGMLGSAAHWTDARGQVLAGLSSAVSAEESAEEAARMRRRERQQRVAYLNRVLRGFACTVSDWQGHAYLLSTFTGKTEIVDNLAQLWPAVERLSGRRADPLDADVLDRMRPAA